MVKNEYHRKGCALLTEEIFKHLETMLRLFLSSVFHFICYSTGIGHYNELVALGGLNNFYNHWRDFYYSEACVFGSITVLSIFMHSFVEVLEKKSKEDKEFKKYAGSKHDLIDIIYRGFSGLCHVSFAITALILFYGIKVNFADNWDISTIEQTEYYYKCCFSHQDLARYGCKCNIDPQYNVTAYFGKAEYSLDAFYTNNSLIVNIFDEKGTVECRECEEVFMISNRTAFIIFIVFHFIVFAWEVFMIAISIKDVITDFKKHANDESSEEMQAE